MIGHWTPKSITICIGFVQKLRYAVIASLDFLGLNHYGTHYVLPSDGSNGWTNGDANIQTENDPAWNVSGIGWNVVPYGFRKMITWVSEEYKLPVYVTENGYGGRSDEGHDDTARQNYYRAYINEMLKSIVLDTANVVACTAWSLMDNFEWSKGYFFFIRFTGSARFGVNYVNFNDPQKARTAKGSAIQLTNIFAANGFPAPDVSTTPITTVTATTSTPTTAPTTVPPTAPTTALTSAPTSAPTTAASTTVPTRTTATPSFRVNLQNNVICFRFLSAFLWYLVT